MVSLVDQLKRLMTVNTGDELRDTRGAALLWLYLCLNVLNVIYGAIVLPGSADKLVVFALLAGAQIVYILMFWVARSGRIDGAAFVTGLIITAFIMVSVPMTGATIMQILTLLAPMLLVSFCARSGYAWALLFVQCVCIALMPSWVPEGLSNELSPEIRIVGGFALMMVVVATTLSNRFQRVLVDRLLEQSAQMDQARERAEHANHAKSLFLAAMSHELRTPLSTIMGYTDLVCESVEDGELDADLILADLSQVKLSGKHLLGLIDDVLDLSRVESGQLQIEREQIDVCELLARLEHEVAPSMRENQNTLHVECDPDLPLLHSDRKRVRQILLNLLSNAAKFTHDGEVTLRASKRLGARDRVEAIDLDVIDTGIGLAREDQQRIFERFEQVDISTTREYGGTGLGLTLSKNLAEALDGVITLESEPGKGSRFTLTIPIDQA